MKVVNLGDPEFHINKNRKLAILEQAVSYNGIFQIEVGNHSDEIGQIDHTDLQWSFISSGFITFKSKFKRKS